MVGYVMNSDLEDGEAEKKRKISKWGIIFMKGKAK